MQRGLTRAHKRARARAPPVIADFIRSPKAASLRKLNFALPKASRCTAAPSGILIRLTSNTAVRTDYRTFLSLSHIYIYIFICMFCETVSSRFYVRVESGEALNKDRCVSDGCQ